MDTPGNAVDEFVGKIGCQGAEAERTRLRNLLRDGVIMA